MSYNVKHTDKNKTPIEVGENVINIENDIVLFGRKKLEYGEDLNANLLHILENFASEEDSQNPGNPDTTATSTIADTAKALLTTPIQGQLWWNKTQNCMFSWDGTAWVPMSMKGDIAVNWGTICDGEQLPKPVSSSGYVFDYDECVWIVSPKFTTGIFEYALCYTDQNAIVTMQYGLEGGSTRQGLASFMIVGLKGNFNLGTPIVVTPPNPNITPTPTGTPAVTPTRTSTPAASGGVTPTPTATQTPAAVTATPTPTVTGTPGGTPAVTPTSTGTPAVTPTPTGTPAVTPTPTGTAAPTPTPSPEAQSGALIPFGDQSVERYNTPFGQAGIVFNGFTNEFLPAQEQTRYHYRLETAAFDVAIAPYIDMGATIGNEPASWGNEYWIYVTGGYATSMVPGAPPLNTWVNIGGSIPIVGELVAEERFSVTIYMQRSISQPSGLGGATLMGTFTGLVSANYIP